MTDTHTTSLTCAQTAKLLRKALKEAFPTTKFSVRSDSYAGGASIDVHWTDGPTAQQVQTICNRFEGVDFDGMQDLKSSKEHVVNGQRIHYRADCVFAHRALSVAFLTKIARAYCTQFGCDMPAILEQSTGASLPQHDPTAEAMMRQAWASSALETREP
jgi:conjugative element/phage-associated large polyvalent protein